MKITKQAIGCIILGILFLFFGTSTQDYYFEALAVLMFILAYIFSDWDNISRKLPPPPPENEPECEVKN